MLVNEKMGEDNLSPIIAPSENTKNATLVRAECFASGVNANIWWRRLMFNYKHTFN